MRAGLLQQPEQARCSETLPATLSRTGTSNIPQRKENNKKTQSFASGFFFFDVLGFYFKLFFFFSWLKITGSRPSTWNQLHTLGDLFIKTLENVLKTCSENFAIPYTCATAQLGAPPAEGLVPTFNSVFPDPSIGESERELKGQELLLKTPSQVLLLKQSQSCQANPYSWL